MILPELSRMIKSQVEPHGTKLLNKKRQLNVRKTNALGRDCVVYPNKSECFHLRILLHVVKGPTYFILLRTFQGITQEIFQGFCKATEFFDASRNSAAQTNIKSRFPYYITKTLKSIKTMQRYRTQSCHFKKPFLIERTLLTGNRTVETVFIPKTPMKPSELPF